MPSLDDELYAAHLGWLEQHRQNLVRRERWDDADWDRARHLADALWDETGLYLYAVEEACRQLQYERGAKRLGVTT